MERSDARFNHGEHGKHGGETLGGFARRGRGFLNTKGAKGAKDGQDVMRSATDGKSAMTWMT
jgi:hypothetical protein